MKPTDNPRQPSRRTVLRGIGAAGIAAGIGTGIGAARPDHSRGRGAENRRKGAADHKRNRPGHKDFTCPDGMTHLGTFEFVVIEDEEGTIVDCYFEQTEGEMDLVTITGFDSKLDEECEPITVYYESAEYTVGQVSSFGGMDTHVDAEPSGGVYESKLESPGGQQAAISLLHICGTELVDDGTTNETVTDDTTTL